MNSEDCIFCKIVKGEAPCHKIWEDEKHLAFLSIFPSTEAFSVVAVKEHFSSYAFDASDEVYFGLARAARSVGRLLDKSLPDVGRTGLIMEGMGVNHLHAKLFPMHGVSKTGEWIKYEPKVDKYFDRYEGYISTHGGKRVDDTILANLAEKIRNVE